MPFRSSLKKRPPAHWLEDLFQLSGTVRSFSTLFHLSGTLVPFTVPAFWNTTVPAFWNAPFQLSGTGFQIFRTDLIAEPVPIPLHEIHRGHILHAPAGGPAYVGDLG